MVIAATLLVGGGMALAQGLPNSGGKVNLDFHDVEIKDAINAISEITGKNFILGNGVSGKITIVSPAPVSVEEAYDAFLIAIGNKELEAVDQGKFTIIQKQDSVNLGGRIENSEEYNANAEKITRIIKLQYIDATTIREALRSKIDRSDNMIAYGPTNSLIITASAAKLRQLESLISMLDRESYKITTEVIPLKYAQADDVAKKVQTIIAAQSGKKGETKRNNIAAESDIASIIPDNRTNALLVTATRKGLEDVLTLLQEIDRPITAENRVGRVHIKRLKHANAEDMASLLANLFGGSGGGSSSSRSSPTSTGEDGKKSTSGGRSTAPSTVAIASGGIFDGEVRVGADPSTNSLLITASQGDYQALLPVIDEMDTQRAQVFVEALIMEVAMGNNLSAGLSFSGAGGNNNSGVFGQSAFGNSPAGLGMLGAKDLAGLLGAPGLLLGASAGGSFNFPGTNIKIPISGAAFQASQSKGLLNVLSAPNILTTDNKKAEISIGSKLPVVTGSFQPTTGGVQTQTSREEVALKLSVTPQINDGDAVTLEIEQQIQEIDESKSKLDKGMVATSERLAKTTVIAQNGQTITLGGLIKDKKTNTTDKVPLFGDIPLVGYMFRKTDVRKEKVNLILFMTPHVIRSPSDLSKISVKKNEERKAFNRKHSIGENQALHDYQLDKGLDMAPKSRPQTEVQPQKRFEYENQKLEDETVDVGEQEALAQKRTSGDAELRAQGMKRVRKTENAEARAKKVNTNPFADIQPPSSN